MRSIPPEVSANVVRGDKGPSQAANQTRQYHPLGAGFHGMKKARLRKEPWVLPSHFQRATEARQCVAVLETLRGGLERASDPREYCMML